MKLIKGVFLNFIGKNINLEFSSSPYLALGQYLVLHETDNCFIARKDGKIITLPKKGNLFSINGSFFWGDDFLGNVVKRLKKVKFRKGLLWQRKILV